MAYVKNIWVDQDVERPKTYEVTTNQDNTITLTDSFGLVTELGTPVNATNMNHIEDGLELTDVTKYSARVTYTLGEWVTGTVNNQKKIFESLTNNNTGNALTDTTKWQEVSFAGDLSGKANIDFSNCIRPYITETHHSGTSGYFVLSDKTCEQWGKTNSANVSFSKVYASQPNVVLTVISSTAGYRNLSAVPTTTGFTIHGTVSSTYPVEWRAVGKLA